MAKYDQMCQAAIDASTRFRQFRERSWHYVVKVVNGLINHCGVPAEQITYLKWNGKIDEGRRYLPPDSGKYTFAGAMEHDDSDGYWHLGIQISLSQLNFVSFVLCVSEEGAVPKVRIGPKGNGQAIYLDNPEELAALCESIGDRVVGAYSDSKSSPSRSIGFVVD